MTRKKGRLSTASCAGHSRAQQKSAPRGDRPIRGRHAGTQGGISEKGPVGFRDAISIFALQRDRHHFERFMGAPKRPGHLSMLDAV